MHLGEGVGQRRVRAPRAGQSGRVVVAADDDRPAPRAPGCGRTPAGPPETTDSSAVGWSKTSPSQRMRSGSWPRASSTAASNDCSKSNSRWLTPAVGGEGVVGAAEVGVTDGSYSHTAPANQRPVTNNKDRSLTFIYAQRGRGLGEGRVQGGSGPAPAPVGGHRWPGRAGHGCPVCGPGGGVGGSRGRRPDRGVAPAAAGGR